MKKDNRSSLERSHSTASNAKLTVLCIISTLAVSCVWALLILKDTLMDKGLGLVFFGAIAVSGLISFFTLIGFKNFTR